MTKNINDVVNFTTYLLLLHYDVLVVVTSSKKNGCEIYHNDDRAKDETTHAATAVTAKDTSDAKHENKGDNEDEKRRQR